MTRAHLQTVSVATTLLLAACPTDPGQTVSESATETGETTGTTTTGSEASDSDPTSNSNPTENTTPPDTTGSNSDSESNSSDTDPTTTDPLTSTTSMGCSDNSECDAATPFCENKMCVACSGAAEPDVACAGVSEDTPVCGPEGCVECTTESKALCVGNKPVCGPDNTCGACTMHADCPDSACNLETGACFLPDYVIYVDRAMPCDVGMGTIDAPFCKISEAFGKMAEDVTLGWTIKIRSGNYIEEPLVVPDGSVVVLSRWGETAPRIRAVDDSSNTLTIQNGTTAFLDNLAFSSNTDYNGVVCAGAKVFADNVRFASNKIQGYESTDCDSTINRSVIYSNFGGGIASYGAGTTRIWNSFISANGHQTLGEFGGLRSAQGNEMHVVYSTVINNLSKMGASSLECVDAGPTEVRNSVIIGFVAPSVDCPTVTFETSAIDEGAMDGDTNLPATKADIALFFEPETMGVYLALAGSALEALAVWKDGDPTTDYNGTARANMDGAADHAGADKP